MEPNDKNKETKKVANKLSSEIKEKEKQLEEIQDGCNHPSEEIAIKNVAGGAERAEFRKVCKLCGKIVGYPSQEELKNEIGN